MKNIKREQILQYCGRDLEAMAFATNYLHWIVDEFSQYTGRCVAEVGAGTGNFSHALLNSTPVDQLIAFEPSQKMYESLSNRFVADRRVEAVNTVLRESCANYKNVFDSIFYVNVLEHIEDDESELLYAYQSLSKTGHICIFVPALSWLYSEFDTQLGHFRRYHKKNLHSLVHSAGFSIVYSRYFDIAGILPWLLIFVVLKRVLLKNKVILYDKYVVPVMRIIEKTVNPPIGKNLLLVGRKN